MTSSKNTITWGKYGSPKTRVYTFPASTLSQALPKREAIWLDQPVIDHADMVKALGIETDELIGAANDDDFASKHGLTGETVELVNALYGKHAGLLHTVGITDVALIVIQRTSHWEDVHADVLSEIRRIYFGGEELTAQEGEVTPFAPATECAKSACDCGKKC